MKYFPLCKIYALTPAEVIILPVLITSLITVQDGTLWLLNAWCCTQGNDLVARTSLFHRYGNMSQTMLTVLDKKLDKNSKMHRNVTSGMKSGRCAMSSAKSVTALTFCMSHSELSKNASRANENDELRAKCAALEKNSSRT